jgi:8-oxo-dGTP diphosphatase
VPLVVIRHAHAGSRGEWNHDDSLRPLSKRGLAQSLLIARRFADVPVQRLVSSPAVRCIQTLAPLAEGRGLVVDVDQRLAEFEASPLIEPVLQLVDELPGDAAICTHGDVIPELIGALARRGMVIASEPCWRKGSAWVLDRIDGAWARGIAVPPPDAE